MTLSLTLMMDSIVRNDRIKAAVGTLLLEALLAYALISGIWARPGGHSSDAMKLFDIVPPAHVVPPPPPPVAVQRKTRAPEGAASPANLRSRATPIVAPRVEPLLPSPVIAAVQPNVGSQATSGASDVPGPGTGSGGTGQGSGSGNGGFGPGGGGRGGSPPRRIGGRLGDSDYPRWAWEAGISGTVEVIYAVQPDGRVNECEVVRSSGSRDLDAFTCQLIERRFRYRPARDRQGRPVRSRVIENHSWMVEIEPPERR
jgi:protein TonB